MGPRQIKAHHQRLAGAVDVGVEQAHAGAFGRERQRQVGGRGALAHAALARGHGDDVLDARQQLHATLRCVRDDLTAHAGGHATDARHGAHGGLGGLAQRRELGLRGVRQHDVEAHLAGVAHLHVLDQPGGHDVAAQVVVHHAGQGLQDLVLRGCAGRIAGRFLLKQGEHGRGV
jgi:hypothetical protein